uniref:Uncharacterized protein n=1 Tax=Talaromyces marneffei PM1 TaxID=1077442 RepID=A0A093VBL5_TALMA
MAAEGQEDMLDFNAQKMDDQMGELLDMITSAFENHPLMQPPVAHPTLFFLFDFIRNTRKELRAIDIQKLREGDAEAKKQIMDVIGRNGLTSALINDTSGKLAIMTGSDPGNPVDFGPDIKDKIRALGPEKRSV